MRYDLLDHIPPELTARIEGTTDTEWFYALCLAQLDDPFVPCSREDMADAARDALGSCATSAPSAASRRSRRSTSC